LIQQPPFSITPGQLEMTDPPVEQVLSDQESDALRVAETTGTVVTRKSKLSEDEIRLGEEAFLNALIELDALGKTAPPTAHESAEKDHSSHGAPAESPTSETDFQHIPSQHIPSQKVRVGDDLQRDDLAAAPMLPSEETAIETCTEDLNIPADVIHRLNSDSSSERCIGLSEVGRLGSENACGIIARAFDDQSEEVRNAAARALFDLQPDRAASFAQTLREASSERRGRIGAALATSGLADIAIGDLSGKTREQGYEAFSLLFLMTKAGEVQPLLRAVESHPNVEVRLTVVKLLGLNGQPEVLPAFRRLAVSGVLPSEVRAAVIEAIYELGRQIPRQVSSGAKI
jgi:hypothetical protein